MKAIEILYNLNPYQQLLDDLYEQAQEDKTFHWSKCLRSQYSFITLQLYRSGKEDLKDTTLAVQITFTVRSEVVVMEEVYCEDKTKTEDLARLIKANKAVHDAQWNENPNNTWYHDHEVTAYINIADDIASVAYLCNSGDDYRPGNFSEIAIDGACIRFEQVNRHNSRSSSHKDDYFLRELKMIVPLDGKPRVQSRLGETYTIGALVIELEDRSSEKNRTCGKAILEKIQQEQAKFEQTKK